MITITGSTGRIGGLVARDLAADGIPSAWSFAMRRAPLIWPRPRSAQRTMRMARRSGGPSTMPAPC